MCFFPLFSRPPKRRYSALYSDDDLPPRKKRVTRQVETPHSHYETLRGPGVKRSAARFADSPPHNVPATLPLRGYGVKRDPPKPKADCEPIKRPAARNSQRRTSQRPSQRSSQRPSQRHSQRNPSRRQSERSSSIHHHAPSVDYPPLQFTQAWVEPPINYHSSYICNPSPPRNQRDGYAVRAATNQALRGLYQESAAPSRNLRRQPACGALRYQEVPWQWQ